ncbi:MAG TPA: TIM44-like domain-containing protein [Acetobacteraceae bacterium]|nr:TIM44-like domain-containing protein [Acetobacteraceae bacterium]
MRRPAFFLAATAALALALAPALAEARPGGGRSAGSRGERTYTAPPPTQTAPGQARPMERTQTQPGQPGVAAPARPGMPAPAPQARSPFMTGLMGGLLGAGLFGLLAGSGLFGGLSGFAAIFGLLLQVLLIAGLVWLVLRLVRGARQPATAGAPQGMARTMDPSQGYGAAARPMGGAPAGAVQLQPSDFQAFERLLLDVNAAWSRQDLNTLRALSTPEMTNYFAQDLRDLEARGWRNETRDLRFEQGDLSEAWHENGQDYATVAMRFSLLDATFDREGRVVEGSTTERQGAVELWTFVRRAPAGRWMLSAIQQTEAARA